MLMRHSGCSKSPLLMLHSQVHCQVGDGGLNIQIGCNFATCLYLSPGAEGFTSESDQEEVRKIERQLKSRFPIGSQVSEQRVVQDFIKQNFSERAVMTVLHIMLRRGELQHRLQRRVLFRVR